MTLRTPPIILGSNAPATTSARSAMLSDKQAIESIDLTILPEDKPTLPTNSRKHPFVSLVQELWDDDRVFADVAPVQDGTNPPTPPPTPSRKLVDKRKIKSRGRKRKRSPLPDDDPTERRKLAKKQARLAKSELASSVELPQSLTQGSLRISPTAAGPKTIQRKFEDFAVPASARAREPNTNLPWLRALREERLGGNAGKNQSLNALFHKAELLSCFGRPYDVWVVPKSDYEATLTPKLEDLLTLGRHPIWIEGNWLQGDRTEYGALELASDMERRGSLKGKLSEFKPTVFDAGQNDATAKEKGPRKTSLAEFKRCMTGKQKPKHPVNWLDLDVDTPTMTFFPRELYEVALDSVVASRKGERSWRPRTWAVASTVNSISPMHVDSLGVNTAIMGTQGRKTFYSPAASFELAHEAFARTGPRDFEHWQEFFGITVSAEGGCLVQGPGFIHWVHTVETGMIIGFHFYSAGTFADTIKAVDRELHHGSASNERSNNEERWQLLADIVDILSDEEDEISGEIFSESQRIDVWASARDLCQNHEEKSAEDEVESESDSEPDPPSKTEFFERLNEWIVRYGNQLDGKRKGELEQCRKECGVNSK